MQINFIPNIEESIDSNWSGVSEVKCCGSEDGMRTNKTEGKRRRKHGNER